MAIVRGTVEGHHDKWDKWNILVNGSWYNTKLEWAKVKPVTGDEVEFDDGGRNYTKQLKIVSKGPGGPAASSAPAKSGGKTWSNVGVEVGHATNLAMTVTLKRYKDNEGEIGTETFYKDFVAQTDKIYQITKALRERYEAGPKSSDFTPPKVEDDEVVLKEPSTSTIKRKPLAEADLDEDIFG